MDIVFTKAAIFDTHEKHIFSKHNNYVNDYISHTNLLHQRHNVLTTSETSSIFFLMNKICVASIFIQTLRSQHEQHSRSVLCSLKMKWPTNNTVGVLVPIISKRASWRKFRGDMVKWDWIHINTSRHVYVSDHTRHNEMSTLTNDIHWTKQHGKREMARRTIQINIGKNQFLTVRHRLRVLI